MQAILRWREYCATNFGDLWDRFVDMVSPVKTQVENILNKLFGFQGQRIEVSDQAIFTLEYSVTHDKEGKKINTSNPITAAQRKSGRFFINDNGPLRPGW